MENSPRILLGFLSAYHPSRWHRRQILREQCLKNSPLPWKFVFGDEPYPGDRERCGIPDDEILHASGSDAKKYLHLKDVALFKYALDNGFDYCLRGCDDSWVFPDRIVRAGLEPFDYAGNFPCKFKLGGTFDVPMARMNYAHGGCGIWLSRKAMQMIVDTPWDEHYLDSWPEKLDVGFGIKFPKMPWYWDDHFLGEVLQGNLGYFDPLRDQPWQSYAANGIACYEDSDLFFNDEPQRPLTIHDPGVHKPNSREMDEVVEQARARNIAAMMIGQPVDVELEPTHG
jgi:hypothetical protein